MIRAADGFQLPRFQIIQATLSHPNSGKSKQMEQPSYVTDLGVDGHLPSFQCHRKMATILPSLGQRPPGKFSASLLCLSCHRQPVWTNVEPKISSSGWIWAAACFFCGSPWLSLLVKCVDCFREWSHTCPRCGKELAVYSPSASCGVATALILRYKRGKSRGVVICIVVAIAYDKDWWTRRATSSQ